MVSPLNRTAQTLIPFEESEIAKEIKTFSGLKKWKIKTRLRYTEKAPMR